MPSKRDRSFAAPRPGAVGAGRLRADEAEALIDFFLAELDQHVRSIEEAYRAGDAEGVRHVAHDLKTAASGLGFPEITKLAGLLEQSLLEEEAALSAAADKVESLIQTCRKASEQM